MSRKTSVLRTAISGTLWPFDSVGLEMRASGRIGQRGGKAFAMSLPQGDRPGPRRLRDPPGSPSHANLTKPTTNTNTH